MTFTFIWAIQNFTIPCQVKSPIFTIKEIEMTRWNLKIYFGCSEPDKLEVARESNDEGPESIKMNCKISFLNSDGLPVYEKSFLGQFKKEDCYMCRFANNSRDEFEKSRRKLLPKDTLTIRCQFQKTWIQILNADLCFARTLLRADRRVFVWAIRKFSFLYSGQMRTFILNSTSTNRISLILFKTENDKKECVNIEVQNPTKNEITTIEISLLDFEGKVKHSAKKIGISKEVTLFKNFIKTRKLAKDKLCLLPNDVLSLRIEIEMNAKIVWNRIENYRYLEATNLGIITTDAGEILRCEQDETVSSSFKQAIRSLLVDGIASDVTLQAGGVSFKAHKNILSARSPVFKAMFSTDMAEKTSQLVEISDVTADALRELLSYIYTDSVGDLQWPDAAELYSAADKYEFLELKKHCATVLMSAVSVSSFGAILNLADMHQDHELREPVEDFLMRQDAGFFESDSWRDYKENNPFLACEIVGSMLCSFKRENGKCQRKF